MNALAIEWHSEKRKISDLIPAPYNPRKWPDKEIQNLTASLEKFSLADPLVINKNNTIIGGHFRLKILKDKGMDSVDVRVPDRLLDEAEEKELNIRLNRNLGLWDFDALANFDEDLLKDIGFDSSELDKIFQLGTPEDDVVPDNAPAICQRGDIYQLGRHRLMCGDSTKREDVERLMDGKKAVMVFTSPPYNAGVNFLGGNKYLKKQKYINDSDSRPEEDYLNLISTALMVSREFSEYQFFNIQQLAGNKTAIIKFLYAFLDYFADVSIWYKGGGRPAMLESVMNSRFEYIFIFCSGQNPTRQIKTNKFRNVSNVFELNPSGKNESSVIHAATFPVEFATHYIEIGCARGNIVIDLFLGSGSTLIACEKTNRICYGMEIDPKYCDTIIKRWEDFTKQKAVKANG